MLVPGRIAQSVARLTPEPETPGSIPGPATSFVSPFVDSRRAVVSYWRKYMHEVLVGCLGGLSLPRKNVVWVTDRPNMTSDVYCGRKTTTTKKISVGFSVSPHVCFILDLILISMILR